MHRVFLKDNYWFQGLIRLGIRIAAAVQVKPVSFLNAFNAEGCSIVSEHFSLARSRKVNA